MMMVMVMMNKWMVMTLMMVLMMVMMIRWLVTIGSVSDRK